MSLRLKRYWILRLRDMRVLMSMTASSTPATSWATASGTASEVFKKGLMTVVVAMLQTPVCNVATTTVVRPFLDAYTLGVPFSIILPVSVRTGMIMDLKPCDYWSVFSIILPFCKPCDYGSTVFHNTPCSHTM